MPYTTIKIKDGYQVKNKKSGRVIAKKTTKTKAKKQISLLKNIDKLKLHAKKHTKQHIVSMRQDIKKGLSFSKSHQNALKKYGK